MPAGIPGKDENMMKKLLALLLLLTLVFPALAEEKGLSVENVELSEGGDGVLLLYVRLRADGEETVLTLSLGGGLA